MHDCALITKFTHDKRNELGLKFFRNKEKETLTVSLKQVNEQLPLVSV